MRNFVFRIDVVRRPRNGSGIRKRVTVWEIDRRKRLFPHGYEDYTFKDDRQAAVEFLIRNEVLPPEHARKDTWTLENEGVATFDQV